MFSVFVAMYKMINSAQSLRLDKFHVTALIHSLRECLTESFNDSDTVASAGEMETQGLLRPWQGGTSQKHQASDWCI